MEKNVIVTDEFGDRIGLTYPKRARGLVKKGRAEYAANDRIRLLKGAYDPPVNDTEDLKMSNVINFNARDFKLESNVDGNKGDRIFITTDVGTAEVWQLGDWQWQWCQITGDKVLERNTDYLLRFAVSGGYCDTCDANTGVWLCGTDGFDSLEAAWEERMAFRLDNDLFAPVISKNERNGVLRVFEIPFNTGNSANWRIVFTAQHAVTRFMTALDNAAYEELPDLTVGQALGGEQNDGGCSGKRKVDFSGAVIANVNEFNDILSRLPGDADIDLSGAIIGQP